MSCKYCKNEVMMLSKDIPYDIMHDKKIHGYDEWQVFIDTRGYLRLADPDDCMCLDNGEKIKISYCPNCGGVIDGNNL